MQPTNTENKNNIITIDCRKQISVSGVTDVVGFDDTSILLVTDAGKLLIEGSDLQITTLDVECGRLCASGKIDSVIYNDKDQGKRGILARIMK